MPGLPPKITDTSRPFWEALDRDEVVLQQCSTCHRLIFYPRIHCPHCYSQNLTWTRVAEQPVLLTWAKSEMPVSPIYSHLAPITLIVADYAGAHVPSTLIDTPQDRVKIGMRLEPAFDRDSYEGFTLLRFRAG
ncbi:Zn-ribbon domain-containing OB-fold protein [Sphingomonas bisphenolicum]